MRIKDDAFHVMVEHAELTYPNECVGAMLGSNDAGTKTVNLAYRLENSAEGSRKAFYQLSNEHLLRADLEARKMGMELIGIYHSHPDADAYFSETDLKNSCPWYSFVVLSIKNGKFDHANSWLPDADQTHADQEELIHGAPNG